MKNSLYLNKKGILVSFWIPVLFFISFFYFPVIFFLGRYFSISYIYSFFKDTLYLKILLFTFKESFLSAFLSLVLALPGAYLVGRTNFVGKQTFLSLSLVSFIMPGISVSLGFVLLFGKNGILNSLLGIDIPILYTFWAIILAHIFYNFALCVKIIGSQWEGYPLSYEEEARIQGATSFQIFYFVDLPYLFPSILSAFLIVFIYSFMSFAVVLVLGGVRYVTLEVEIYMYLTKLINFDQAAKLAWIQFLILLFLTYLLLLTKKGFTFEYGKELINEKKFPLWGYFYLLGVILIIFVPMFSMFMGGFWDFINQRITLLWFKNLFSQRINPYIGIPLLVPILNTLKYALYTGILSLFIIIVGSFYAVFGDRYRYIFSLILISSLFISPITFAFSYIYLGNWITIPIRILIIIAHTIIALPIGMQIFFEGRRSIPSSIRDAAFVDGAGVFKTFIFVELPILIPYLISTLTISMAISMGEVGATLLLYDVPQNATIPVAMVRLLSARRLGEAQAFSSLLFIFAFLLFLFTDFFLRKRLE